MSLNPDTWITEIFEDRTAFSVRYARKLYDEQSDFQMIEIYETDELGRVLLLNGCFMVTEKDAFIYHEMLVHPAMSILPNTETVLVVGGGDGGAVTELVKYDAVRSITLCEIDPLVVGSSKIHLPGVSKGLDDPRVEVLYQDATTFIRDTARRYDLILVDSTDPVGPGKSLFELPFFQSVSKALAPGGAVVLQTESPLYMERVFAAAVRDLSTVFRYAVPYFATVPCYPGGLWSFTFCSDRHDPKRADMRESPGIAEERFRYYDREVHRAAFVPPKFVRELLDRGSSCQSRETEQDGRQIESR